MDNNNLLCVRSPRPAELYDGSHLPRELHTHTERNNALG